MVHLGNIFISLCFNIIYQSIFRLTKAVFCVTENLSKGIFNVLIYRTYTINNSCNAYNQSYYEQMIKISDNNFHYL
jgi:hypothetical protein